MHGRCSRSACCVLAGVGPKMTRFSAPSRKGLRVRAACFWVSPMTGFSTARQHMVDGQIRPSDVTDSRIIDAMLAVPREAFVPASQRALAYLDLDLDVSESAS